MKNINANYWGIQNSESRIQKVNISANSQQLKTKYYLLFLIFNFLILNFSHAQQPVKIPYGNDTLYVFPTDNATSIAWGDTSKLTGAVSVKGIINTDTIITKLGAGNYAAYLCDTLNALGYSDWYLPSKEELTILNQNKSKLSIGTGNYWSSTELDKKNAVRISFANGGTFNVIKLTTSYVRCIRKEYFCKDNDGNNYHSVTIGSQTWMKENLKSTRYNDGTAIPNITDNTTWSNLTSGARCYYNNDSLTNKKVYGGLYNWYAVNTGKLCPTNFHVPDSLEWAALSDYLGGDAGAGDKLKDTGTTLWTSGNAGTNSTGFTALPGGDRSSTGSYASIAISGFWWYSTEKNITNAWNRSIGFNNAGFNRNSYDKHTGVSVRCIKDTCDLPSVALAGNDIMNIQGTSMPLSAQAPIVGTGLWRILSGNGGSLNIPSSPNCVLTGNRGIVYKLEWSVTTGCGVSRDTIQLYFLNNKPMQISYNNKPLFVTPIDISNNCKWGGFNISTNATSNDGMLNTDSIVKHVGINNDTAYAAKMCDTLNAYGFTDWYLPSKNELDSIYPNRLNIGGFSLSSYWSSSECDLKNSWAKSFWDGSWYKHSKYSCNYVRCVRHGDGTPITNLVADFTVDHTSGNAPLTVAFTDQSTGNIAKHYWQFDENNFSNNTNTAFIFKHDGLYHVCLTISDTSGKQSVQCKDIKVGNTSCKAAFEEKIDSATRKVTFADSSSAGVNQWYWQFGDGTTSTLKNPVHTYNAARYYDVTLSAKNTTNSCQQQVSKQIKVADVSKDCKADFSYVVDLDTKNVSFNDHSQYTGNATFTWDFGDNQVDYTSKISHTYADAGYHNVCLTMQTAGCRNLACKNIKAGKDTVYCKAAFSYVIDPTNKKVSFNDLSAGLPNQWQWDFGDGGKSLLQNPSYTFKDSGYFPVHLSARNTLDKCIDHQEALIYIGNTAPLKLKAYFFYLVDSTYNSKGFPPIQFRGSGYGYASTVVWDFGDGSPNYTRGFFPIHQYTEEGKYKVCYTVSDSVFNFENSHCDTVTVKATGIEEISGMENEFNIYPNPAREKFEILNSKLEIGNSNINLQILNSLGQTVFSQQLIANSKQQTIDISCLPDGIYFVKIGNAVKKLIIQK